MISKESSFCYRTVYKKVYNCIYLAYSREEIYQRRKVGANLYLGFCYSLNKRQVLDSILLSVTVPNKEQVLRAEVKA